MPAPVIAHVRKMMIFANCALKNQNPNSFNSCMINLETVGHELDEGLYNLDDETETLLSDSISLFIDRLAEKYWNGTKYVIV